MKPSSDQLMNMGYASLAKHDFNDVMMNCHNSELMAISERGPENSDERFLQQEEKLRKQGYMLHKNSS